MRADIVLTTLENGELIEKVIGHTTVTLQTDIAKLLGKLADNKFGPESHVRRDTALFGFTAVKNDNRNTIHLV